MMGGEEVGRLRVRDCHLTVEAATGIYADLLLIDLFLKEGAAAGRWPVSKASSTSHEIAGPSFYQRVGRHGGSRNLSRAPGGRGLGGDPRRAGPRTRLGPGVPVVEEPRALATHMERMSESSGLPTDSGAGLVRSGGTEPLDRVYTESNSAGRQPTRIIAAGESSGSAERAEAAGPARDRVLGSSGEWTEKPEVPGEGTELAAEARGRAGRSGQPRSGGASKRPGGP